MLGTLGQRGWEGLPQTPPEAEPAAGCRAWTDVGPGGAQPRPLFCGRARHRTGIRECQNDGWLTSRPPLPGVTGGLAVPGGFRGALVASGGASAPCQAQCGSASGGAGWSQPLSGSGTTRPVPPPSWPQLLPGLSLSGSHRPWTLQGWAVHTVPPDTPQPLPHGTTPSGGLESPWHLPRVLFCQTRERLKRPSVSPSDAPLPRSLPGGGGLCLAAAAARRARLTPPAAGSVLPTSTCDCSSAQPCAQPAWGRPSPGTPPQGACWKWGVSCKFPVAPEQISTKVAAQSPTNLFSVLRKPGVRAGPQG